jgi:uncharacterized damage-inducible protein DinB
VTSAELLTDAFGRIREEVHGAATGLTAEQLACRIDGSANSIGWLVWHLSRVQDDHIADVAGVEQVYTAQGWAKRFGFPFSATAIGYGHRSGDVDSVRVDSAEMLLGYHDAVHAQTLRFLESLEEAELTRVVDANWDPPVTLAVRLVSVVSDDLQHAGQAAFVRGVVERRGPGGL